MSRARSNSSGILADHAALMRHHRRAWLAERIGWAAMALLLGATLLGAFGDGPLSRARSGSGTTAQVEYDRIVRSSAPTEYRFTIDSALVDEDHVRLRVDRSLLDDIELDSIVPEPEYAVVGPGYTEYVFRAGKGAAPLKIDVRYRPATFGRHSGRVWVKDRLALDIDQFAYP